MGRTSIEGWKRKVCTCHPCICHTDCLFDNLRIFLEVQRFAYDMACSLLRLACNPLLLHRCILPGIDCTNRVPAWRQAQNLSAECRPSLHTVPMASIIPQDRRT